MKARDQMYQVFPIQLDALTAVLELWAACTTAQIQ